MKLFAFISLYFECIYIWLYTSYNPMIPCTIIVLCIIIQSFVWSDALKKKILFHTLRKLTSVNNMYSLELALYILHLRRAKFLVNQLNMLKTSNLLYKNLIDITPKSFNSEYKKVLIHMYFDSLSKLISMSTISNTNIKKKEYWNSKSDRELFIEYSNKNYGDLADEPWDLETLYFKKSGITLQGIIAEQIINYYPYDHTNIFEKEYFPEDLEGITFKEPTYLGDEIVDSLFFELIESAIVDYRYLMNYTDQHDLAIKLFKPNISKIALKAPHFYDMYLDAFLVDDYSRWYYKVRIRDFKREGYTDLDEITDLITQEIDEWNEKYKHINLKNHIIRF